MRNIAIFTIVLIYYTYLNTMIPRFIILAAFMLGCLPCSLLYAQETSDPSKHIFRVGLLYYIRQTSSLPNYTVTGDAPLGIFLGYKEDTDEVVRIFLQAQYTSGKRTYTRDPISGIAVQSDFIAKGFSFFAGLDFHYFRWTHCSIYSGVAGGFSNMNIKINEIVQEDSIAPFSTEPPYLGRVLFLQFKALAFEFKPIDHFSFFTECNLDASSVGLYKSIGLAFGANYHL